jgi:hypothetical protein
VDFNFIVYFLLIFPFISIVIMYLYWDNIMKKIPKMFEQAPYKRDVEEMKKYL